MKIGTQGGNLIQPAASLANKEQASPQSNKAELSNKLGMLADVYHKNSVKDPTPTYDRPLSISSNDEVVTKTVDEALDDIALATVHLYTPGGELSQSVERMTKQYEGIMSELNEQHPQLANKDWGISITESGELQVTGSLTEDERTLVEQTLNSNDEFVTAANDFKSSYLKYIDMEVRGWARYDVNEENFSQVFDLKDMLDSSKANDEFKSAWGYESNWMKLHDNISAQLSSKASKY
ncbi:MULTISPECIES: hypothetical protein [Pseudoalteromonas]|uniref:Uncharacterized protein n=1 Tax=Pseudoalteromonas amylolytica TaxID=1859457 RepID=A0A1S1MS68_9GAMM|nr:MULTISPECIES: hypothetical protein [Pseudoalteromonas]OHU86195.1 hypothetical protein BFC16_15940 [Pseudoalteromonas sp. JW3]OHU89699.1 hypothetical protein BET10_16380 [Pseudoalteromonas amylolytica]